MNMKERQERFFAMLQRCDGIVYKVCLMHTDRSVGQVNDLYQEIVCNLWRGYLDFREESKEATWVWRVALNTASSHHRYEKKMPKTEKLPAYLADTRAEEQPDPLVERLYELVSLLPQGDKKLANMYLEDMSVSEMAEVLKCSESTVKRRISRLKETLKRMNETID